jgi:hypothetical protein
VNCVRNVGKHNLNLIVNNYKLNSKHWTKIFSELKSPLSYFYEELIFLLIQFVSWGMSIGISLIFKRPYALKES